MWKARGRAEEIPLGELYYSLSDNNIIHATPWSCPGSIDGQLLLLSMHNPGRYSVWQLLLLSMHNPGRYSVWQLLLLSMYNPGRYSVWQLLLLSMYNPGRYSVWQLLLLSMYNPGRYSVWLLLLLSMYNAGRYSLVISFVIGLWYTSWHAHRTSNHVNGQRGRGALLIGIHDTHPAFTVVA